MPKRRKQARSDQSPDRNRMSVPDWISERKIDRALLESGVYRVASFFDRMGSIKKSAPLDLRWEDDVIESVIPRGASALDLGCGEGDLLRRLIESKNIRGQGIERDPANVEKCVAKGAPVFQIDLNKGLALLPDKSFEYVILEETLQTLARPDLILKEIARVGEMGIISFPNFGYWRVRLDFLARGRMPKTDWLPFDWFDTPNIHMLTLQDFIDWARAENLEIVKGFVYLDGATREIDLDTDNLYAEATLLIVKESDQKRARGKNRKKK